VLCDDYPKWKVAVISTDYDLHYLRSTVESTLKELDFEVVAFERPDYPVYPKVHSHKACLLAIQNSDIVVLFVDKRFGGLYLGKGPESITEKEYFEAYELGKIIIPCVNKKAEQERFDLFNVMEQLMERDNISLGEARKKINPGYVENWKVLDFIEEIRKADRDNFSIYFEDPINFKNRLKGRLQGLTRFVCHKIIEAENESVKSVKTAMFALSLGDVLKKGYFIEPPYKLLSGETSPEKMVSRICDLADKNKRIMIMGRPGIGKSTLLVKSFLSHTEICLEQKSNQIPLYISLRGLGPNYHFDFDQFIKECCQQYLRRDIYPVFEKDQIEPVFYIDGFDELAEQSSDIDLHKVVSSKFFSSPFIVCSRIHFAEERLESSGFASQIHILIELLQWGKEHSWRYIEKFCNLREKPELYDEMFRAYHENEEMKEIFENPLLLTMFLWIVEESKMILPLDVKDQVSVYDRFIDLWIKRELARVERNDLKMNENYAEMIKRAWQLTAWKIYKGRFTGKAINKVQLTEWLVSFNRGFEEVLNIPAYWDFLDIRPHTEEIRGMFHEQFMEHLLAKEIISCSKEERDPFPEFLKYEIRHEINKIVRTLWMQEKREDIRKMLRNFWRVYEEYLTNKDALGIAVRNHAMYYIGRLPDPEAKEKLIVASAMEREVFVKLSIAFGLIKLENYGMENELFEKLKNDEVWDKANRGYHLVYYEDWILKDEEPPYFDDGTKTWRRTLKALLRHIQSQERRHVALRRIELFTIRRFIEARGSCNPMIKDHLKIIEESIKCIEVKAQGFLKKVEDEFHKLKNAFEKINKV
jgi:hypothetical protein